MESGPLIAHGQRQSAYIMHNQLVVLTCFPLSQNTDKMEKGNDTSNGLFALHDTIHH